MLKVDYTENGNYLETVTMSREELIAQRALLAIRLGYPFYVKPDSTGTILIAGEETLIHQLERALYRENVSLYPAEPKKLELTVVGLWISENINSCQGTLITSLNDEAESLIKELCVLN